MSRIDELVERGEIGGRTVEIVSSGAVQCATRPVPATPDGGVLVRTVRSAISPGTEMTFYGRDASNVYLHKRWNEELRLFEQAAPSMEYPVVFGYRAAGEVVESRTDDVRVGTRLFGNWRHTEFTTLSAEQAAAQVLPDGLTWEDGVDIAQMGPICVNAVAFAEGEHGGGPAVVFGAGPVGLITAQVAAAEGAQVVVVDRIAARVAIARDLGLDAFEAGDGIDTAAALKGRFGADGIAVAWECAGSTVALNEAIRVVRRQGLVVAVGFYQGDGRGLWLGDEFHHNGIRVVCGQIGNIHRSTTRAALIERTKALALAGTVRLGGLPRLTVPIDRVADAFDALTRPAEVLQAALRYDRTNGAADG
jgi:threonine dehydrogenase-like Zn-dependent dehydrogenase